MKKFLFGLLVLSAFLNYQRLESVPTSLRALRVFSTSFMFNGFPVVGQSLVFYNVFLRANNLPDGDLSAVRLIMAAGAILGTGTWLKLYALLREKYDAAFLTALFGATAPYAGAVGLGLLIEKLYLAKINKNT